MLRSINALPSNKYKPIRFQIDMTLIQDDLTRVNDHPVQRLNFFTCGQQNIIVRAFNLMILNDITLGILNYVESRKCKHPRLVIKKIIQFILQKYGFNHDKPNKINHISVFACLCGSIKSQQNLSDARHCSIAQMYLYVRRFNTYVKYPQLIRQQQIEYLFHLY